jgi:hypothetical protein
LRLAVLEIGIFLIRHRSILPDAVELATHDIIKENYFWFYKLYFTKQRKATRVPLRPAS